MRGSNNLPIILQKTFDLQEGIKRTHLKSGHSWILLFFAGTVNKLLIFVYPEVYLWVNNAKEDHW